MLAGGKGRKQRAVTLRPETVAILRQWLTERHGQPDDPLFPTRQDSPSAQTPSNNSSPNTPPQQPHLRLAQQQARDNTRTPHVIHVAHTNAMLLRAKGIDIATIACGSGTKAPRPPTSTNTPTPHSKNKRSHEPPRSAPSPAATDHPTRSSPSSKPCDYVERAVGLNRQITGHRARAQHNRSHDIQPVTWNST